MKRAPTLTPVERANAVAAAAGRKALLLLSDVRDPRPEAPVHALWRWLVQRGAAQ